MDMIFENLDGYDDAHWGVSDWYDENRAAMIAALAKGPDYEWDTGWYSVKKEIHTGRVKCESGKIHLYCSCSDDFDTIGSAYSEIPWTDDLNKIANALDVTMDDAEENRAENALYAGFSIIKDDKSWLETLILPRGYGTEMHYPPGDNYGEWGFQGECDELTDNEKEAIEKYAQDYVWGDTTDKSFTIGRWTVRPWRE